MIDSLTDLTPPLILMAVLNSLGVLFKASPIVADKYIPYVLIILGAIGYPILAYGGDVNFQSHSNMSYNVVLGIMFALSSIGGHQLVKQPTKGNANENVSNSNP